MADKYTDAMQMFQSGLNTSAQMAQQTKLAALQQAKQKYDTLKQDREFYLKALQDKTTPPALVESLYNRYAAIESTLDPSIKMPLVKDITPEDQDLIKAIVHTRLLNMPENKKRELLADIISKANPQDIQKIGQSNDIKNILTAVDPRLTQTGNYQQGSLERDGKILASSFDTTSGKYIDNAGNPIEGELSRGYKPDLRPDASGTLQRVTPAGNVSQVGQEGQFAKRPSDETVKQFGDFNTLKEQLSRVKATYKPEFVGVISGRVGKVKQVTGVGATKERSNFLSNLNSIRNQLVYLRSGKQINEQEYKRLLAEMPNEDTSSVDFEAKLNNFGSVFDELVTNRQKAFRETGHVVPSSDPARTGFKVGEAKQIGGFTIRRKK